MLGSLFFFGVNLELRVALLGNETCRETDVGVNTPEGLLDFDFSI